MASPKFDRDRALKILLDAQDMGDAKACKSWKITTQTLRNYRKRLADDPELLQALALKRAELEDGWKRERLEALRFGVRRLQELMAKATVKQLRDVAGAVKILGDLQVVSTVLDEQPGADPEGEEPAKSAGQPPSTAPVH